MPSFDQIGVEFVIAGIAQAKRDADSAVSLMNNVTQATDSSSRKLSAANAAQVQSVMAAYDANGLLATSYDKAAIAAFASAEASQKIQIAVRSEAEARAALAAQIQAEAAFAAGAGNLAELNMLEQRSLRAKELTAALEKEAIADRAVSDQASRTAVALNAEAEAAARAAEAATVKAGVAADAAVATAAAEAGATAMTAAVGMVAALGAAGAAAVKFGADYSASMQIVQTRTQATAEQMRQLDGINNQVITTFGIAATSAAQYEVALSRAGISIEQMTNGAAVAVAQLARATGTDLNQSALLVANSLNAFSASGVSAAQIARDLSNGINYSALSASQFATAIATSANQAIALKIPYDQLVAVIAELGKSGAVSSRDVNTLSQALISVLNPSNQVRNQFENFNQVLLYQKNGSLDLIGTLQNLNNTYGQGAVEAGKISQATADLNMRNIGGAQSARDIAIALSDVANQGPAVLKAIQDTDKAQQDATGSTNTFTGAMGRLFSTLGTTAAEVGGPVVTSIAKLAEQQTNAAQTAQDYLKWGDEVNRVAREGGMLFEEAAQKVGSFSQWEAAAAQAALDQANAEKEANAATAAESATAVSAASNNEALANSHKDAAAAARAHAAAEREVAAAMGQATTQAANSLAETIVQNARGTSIDPVQQARNTANAEVTAAQVKASGVVEAAKQEQGGVQLAAALEMQTVVNDANATAGAKAAAQEKYASVVESTNARIGKAESEAATIQSQAQAKAAADIRVAEVAEERKNDRAGAAAAKKDQSTINSATNASDRMTAQANSYADKFEARFAQLTDKAKIDFQDMADAFKERLNDMDQAHKLQIANIETQIADEKAAFAQRQADNQRRLALEQQIVAETKTFNEQIKQEELGYQKVNDQVQLQHDLLKRQMEAGIDPASMAADTAQRAAIEQQQLASATTQAQRDQITANFNLNEKVAQAGVASKQAEIDKKQKIDEFDVAFRESQAAVQADQQKKLDVERTAFQQSEDAKRMALQDSMEQEALNRQINREHQRESEVEASYNLQIQKATEAYNRETTRRQQALTEQEKALVDSFNEQMKSLDAHMTNEVNALNRSDARVAKESETIGNNLIDQANQIGQAAHNAAAQLAAALHLPAPPPFNTTPHYTGVFPIVQYHEGGVVPGLPGQEQLALLKAGEIVLRSGAMGGPQSVYNQNTNNHTWSFQANYAQTQAPVELQHDINAIMAMAKGR